MEAAHARPVLRVIDGNGELCPNCSHLLTTVTEQAAAIERYKDRAKHAEERERERKAALAAQEPSDERAVSVLDYWCDRVLEEGWWLQRPRYEPNDARWKATKAALNKGRGAEYLRLAIDEALREAAGRRNSRGFRRWYLEPAHLFRDDFVESFYNAAMDPKRSGVKLVRELPVALRDRWPEVVSQADICDCGHARFDHDRPRPIEGVLDPPCAVHGCHCTAFDDFHVRSEAWLRERDLQARRRMG